MDTYLWTLNSKQATIKIGARADPAVPIEERMRKQYKAVHCWRSELEATRWRGSRVTMTSTTEWRELPDLFGRLLEIFYHILNHVSKCCQAGCLSIAELPAVTQTKHGQVMIDRTDLVTA
jgi:hypothetical protein